MTSKAPYCASKRRIIIHRTLRCIAPVKTTRKAPSHSAKCGKSSSNSPRAPPPLPKPPTTTTWNHSRASRPPPPPQPSPRPTGETRHKQRPPEVQPATPHRSRRSTGPAPAARRILPARLAKSRPPRTPVRCEIGPRRHLPPLRKSQPPAPRPRPDRPRERHPPRPTHRPRPPHPPRPAGHPQHQSATLQRTRRDNSLTTTQTSMVCSAEEAAQPRENIARDSTLIRFYLCSSAFIGGLRTPGFHIVLSLLAV